MSVADGQVFLQRPAASGGYVVSPRDSVSRIGQAAAAPALRAVGGGAARLQLVQADDADAFGAAAGYSAAHAAALRMHAALHQRPAAPRRLSEQVAALLALRSLSVASAEPAHVRDALDKLVARLHSDPQAEAAMRDIDATGELTSASAAALEAVVRNA